MRNVLLVPNKKRSDLKQGFFISLFLVVLCIVAFVICMTSYFSKNIDKVQEIIGVVSEVNKEDNGRFSIILNDREYCLVSVVSDYADEEDIAKLVGQDVVLYQYHITSDSDVIGFNSSVFSIDKETGFNYILSDNRAGCIVIGCFLGFMIAFCITVFVLFKKEKREVRGDVFKLMNETTKGIVTTSPFRKKMMKLMCIPLLLALLLIIPLFTYIEINLTVTFVCLGVFLACVIGLIIALIIMLPNIQKREFDYYAELLDGLENLPEKEYSDIVMDVGNMFSFKLTEEGLLYNKLNEVDFIIQNFYSNLPDDEKESIRAELISAIREAKNTPAPKKKNIIDYVEGSELTDETLLKYGELNLNTKVCFRKMNLPIAIFITSNLSEEQFPSMRNDIFLELSEDLYYYLKKFNIHVSGLEKVLKNKMEYMKKYCKSVFKGDKNTYIEVTDEGERMLFEDKK